MAGYPNVEFTANRQQIDGSATDSQSYDHTQGNRVIGTINYELGSGHTLTSVTSYSDFGSNRFRDTDLLPGDYINTYYYQGNRQFQQEFRLTSPAEASPQGLCARQRFGGHNENTGYATSLRRAMGSLRVRNSPGESRFALCHR